MSKLEIVGRTRYPREQLKRLVVNQLRARLSELEKQLKTLGDTLRRLHRKYDMDWKTFEENFGKGSLPEDADLDYIDWKAAVRMLPELKRQRDQLKEALK